ncbi:hypothetical protein P171DRAFT_519356 [Karstenula rhodostoma CBS 690.94]|uniref:Uncharacterized protein n=1 Tax=Karstenula rhodostoma CBS 690.94 TaxID=1392251 RepID=A0A9P4PN34_9PLEO|nr:hypothetical protein P171DRAFT_519356 [Karstenula rhodostoma CBS 690.94]
MDQNNDTHRAIIVYGRTRKQCQALRALRRCLKCGKAQHVTHEEVHACRIADYAPFIDVSELSPLPPRSAPNARGGPLVLKEQPEQRGSIRSRSRGNEHAPLDNAISQTARTQAAPRRSPSPVPSDPGDLVPVVTDNVGSPSRAQTGGEDANTTRTIELARDDAFPPLVRWPSPEEQRGRSPTHRPRSEENSPPRLSSSEERRQSNRAYMLLHGHVV